MKYCCAALLALLIICPCARALALPGLSQLYETYAWSSYPDVEVLRQPDTRRMQFPGSTGELQLAAEYGEIEYYGHGTLGVVVLSGTHDGYVSVIHYSSDGWSRIIHRQLPLLAKQQVTLSGALPRGIDGVTLLLFWEDSPDLDALVALARDPNAIDIPVPGVSETHWFMRCAANLYFDPWRDIFRPANSVPELHAEAGWPWCSSRLTSRGTVVAKDCAVSYSGLTDWGMDDYGTYGRWRLDWSSELTLVCELPVSESWMSAAMLIYCGNTAAEQEIDLSALELTINGWPVTPHYLRDFAGLETQPVALSLSQYLRGGSNRITLSVSSLASSEWLIDGIELWVY